MTVILPRTIVAGCLASWVQDNDVALRNYVNGNLSADELTSTLRGQLGLSDASTVRRGATIIATSEARTNTAYGTLTTPDQVTNVVVPTNGLLRIGYQATWVQSNASTARAAIFIGANQLQIGTATGPTVQEAQIGGTTSPDVLMGTYGAGLTSMTAGFYTGDVTTGQILGGAWVSGPPGPCLVFVAAGTYTVSVQFKSSAGSVTVKNRRLYVETWAP